MWPAVRPLPPEAPLRTLHHLAVRHFGAAVVHLHAHPAGAGPGCVTPMEFALPLAVGLASVLFLTSAFVALSPAAGERAARRGADELAVEDLAAATGPDRTG